MTPLSLSLLGSFEVRLDEEPVTRFESDKVRALLAYLAVESERPHRRETLAGLLWPEWPERRARQNLNQALFNLRRAIRDREAQPPFLLVSRATIQFNRRSDHWLDATAFTDLLSACQKHDHRRLEDCDPCLERLQEAVELYQGSFLEGFSVGDSPAFEGWAVLERERLHRLAMEALDHGADCYAQRGEYGQALHYARRQAALEPWREEAQRRLMLLLALDGQRSAALVQYETCHRILAEELGVEPSAETRALYEQIRDGDLSRGAGEPGSRGEITILAPLPSFFSEASLPPDQRTTFVAREQELARLDHFFDLVLAAQGRVVFVTGEAGTGKTALAQEFARRAQEVHPDLIVAGGNCNAHTGVGDPYLPFRQALALLTGDVEARWAAGAMSQEQASRLWQLIPLVVQALLDNGPDLIDTFVPGGPLAARAAAAADGAAWLTQLEQQVAQGRINPGAANLKQSDLFEQYTRVLGALARQQPLLLLLDDLQWADPASISLLFHLGRRLKGKRIMIIGAYRPAEVALGRAGERHPLEAVVNEFQRDLGEIEVPLSGAGDRSFVEALLDSEPNRLGVEFRQTLYRQTRGHPLFTGELLRGMQERGDLVRDEAGRWVEGSALAWEILPARVEAVIEERIGRLPAALREALAVASVEGETFTAEVVARVQKTGEREMVQQLSGALEKKHHLVRTEGIQRLGSQRLSLYRFRHILFQRYLYSSLDEVERTYLHEEVGVVLERLYRDQIEEIAGQLARHFEEAGMAEKAVTYLCQAGERAIRLAADQEAVAHLSKGLALLETLPDTIERARQELRLLNNLGNSLGHIKGEASPEVEKVYTRAWELCQQVGETTQHFQVLHGLWTLYALRPAWQTARELAEQVLLQARDQDDATSLLLAHRMLGVTLVYLGELAPALAHLKAGIALYNAEQHSSLTASLGSDPGVSCLAFAALTLWLLGYPDQALKRLHEALSLAQALSQPFVLSLVLIVAAEVHRLRREGQVAHDRAEAAVAIATEHRSGHHLALGTIKLGWALVERGKIKKGIVQIQQGLADLRAMQADHTRPLFLTLLAEAWGKAGQLAVGLSAVAEGLEIVEKTGTRLYEPELYLLKGELLLLRGEAEAEAEVCLQRAIELARRQEAKSWELRAAVRLSRLWQRQGKRDEARQMLAEIYAWFGEGFETLDLREARSLLEALS